MKQTPLISAIALAAALPLMLVSCSTSPAATDDSSAAGSTAEDQVAPESSDPAAALADLQAEGVLPMDFPATQNLTGENVDGSFAFTWKGDPLTEGCVNTDVDPEEMAGTIQVPEGVTFIMQQCGDVWQVVQSNGENTIWN